MRIRSKAYTQETSSSFMDHRKKNQVIGEDTD